MRALVTGSSGFIGSFIVEALLARNIAVTCLLRSESRPAYLQHLDVDTCEVDFRKPETLLACKAFADADVLIHAAGVTKRITRDQFFSGNVEPTKNLLETLRVLKSPLQRFVFLSSQAAVGPARDAGHFLTESEPPKPIEFYGESKRVAEQLVQEYAGHVPFTIIRPGGVYGPRDVDFLNLFRQIKHRLNIYAGNRHKLFSIIYVHDLVQGILDAMLAPVAAGKIYHLAAPEPLSWQTLQEKIVAIMGRKVLHFSIPPLLLRAAGRLGDLTARMTGRHPLLNSQKIRLSLPDYWLMSSEAAHRDFGFSAKTPLDNGLRQTRDWYEHAGWL